MQIKFQFNGSEHTMPVSAVSKNHNTSLTYWEVQKSNHLVDRATDNIFRYDEWEKRHIMLQSPTMDKMTFVTAVIKGLYEAKAEAETALAAITDDKSPEYEQTKAQVKNLASIINRHEEGTSSNFISRSAKESARTVLSHVTKIPVQRGLNFGGAFYRFNGDNLEMGGHVNDIGGIVEHGLQTAVNPEAKCPVWEERLAAAYPDVVARKYFQLCMGATLDPAGKRVFFWKGGSNTGKSTLKNILSEILNPYWGVYGVGDIIKDGNGEGDAGSKSSLMKAANQTCRIKDEIKASATLNLAALKEATGGATKEAKYMNQNMSSVFLSGNVMLISNDELNTGSLDDPAMKSRFHVIPAPVSVDLARVYTAPDGSLLKSANDVVEYISNNEAEGVLLWILEGLHQAMALRGNEEGIRKLAPAEVEAAEADWNRRVIGGDLEDVLAELGLKFGEEHVTANIRKNAVIITDLVQVIKRSEASNDYIKNKMGLQRMVDKLEKIAKVKELTHGAGRTKKYVTNLYWMNFDVADDAEPEEYPVGRKIVNDLKTSISLINSQKIRESVIQNSRFDCPQVTQRLQQQEQDWKQEGLY